MNDPLPRYEEPIVNKVFSLTSAVFSKDAAVHVLNEQVAAYFWCRRTSSYVDLFQATMKELLARYRASSAYIEDAAEPKVVAAAMYQHRLPIHGSLPAPVASEIATHPTLVPEWYTIRQRNRRQSPIYQLSDDILRMVFVHLFEGDVGVARQACAWFLQVVSRPVACHTISDDMVKGLSPKVRRIFEESKRTRFNLLPVPPQQLLYGYGTPEYLRHAREAALQRQMCYKCAYIRRYMRSCFHQSNRYCKICKVTQPRSAFAPKFEIITVSRKCRLATATLPVCEHSTLKVTDLLKAANATIDLRRARGILLSEPSCDANARYGKHYKHMTADIEHKFLKRLPPQKFKDYMKNHGGKRYSRGPGWPKEKTLTGLLRKATISARVSLASRKTKRVEAASRAVAPTGFKPRDLPKSDSGEYAEISWCNHPDHEILCRKDTPSTYGRPRVVMSHAVGSRPESHGAMTMIWAGHMLDIPASTRLTREKLGELIAGIDMDRVPTVCPHVKQQGLKQLALAFAEYQCCCFDAPANVDSPDKMPIVAHQHPWTEYNAHIAEYQYRKHARCRHEPGSEVCCRCYNDDRPGARHTSPRTLMPEWADDEEGRKTPRALHAYQCNLCATQYRWQRKGRRLFLETRKEISIEAFQNGWPTTNIHIPGIMFSQFVDPEEMYEMRSGPMSHEAYFCENKDCYVRYDPRVWLRIMLLDPDGGVGRPHLV